MNRRELVETAAAAFEPTGADTFKCVKSRYGVVIPGATYSRGFVDRFAEQTEDVVILRGGAAAPKAAKTTAAVRDIRVKLAELERLVSWADVNGAAMAEAHARGEQKGIRYALDKIGVIIEEESAT